MNIRKCLEAKIMEIGFHGNANRIAKFEERFVGIGADANSPLGVYSTQLAESGAEYARNALSSGEGQEAVVHVLAMPSVKTYLMTDTEGFYGLTDDLSSQEDFSRFRTKLLSQGYDSLQIETGEDVIFVALVPERVKVLAYLTPEQAEDLDVHGFDGLSIYRDLRYSDLLVDDNKSRKKTASPRNTGHGASRYASDSLFPEMSY